MAPVSLQTRRTQVSKDQGRVASTRGRARQVNATCSTVRGLVHRRRLPLAGDAPSDSGRQIVGVSWCVIPSGGVIDLPFHKRDFTTRNMLAAEGANRVDVGLEAWPLRSSDVFQLIEICHRNSDISSRAEPSRRLGSVGLGVATAFH